MLRLHNYSTARNDLRQKKSKIAKKDAREIQRVKLLIIPPLDLTSHTFCFGRILGCSVCAKSQTFKKYTLLTKFEK